MTRRRFIVGYPNRYSTSWSSSRSSSKYTSYVDLDLNFDALPAGSRLAIGDWAVIEVTDQPHNGRAKFAARFGRDAHKLVWTEEGKRLRPRGLNARVLVGGTIRAGDPVRQG